MARRLDDRYEIEYRNREKLGKEWRVTCDILRIGTGKLIHTFRATGDNLKKAEDRAYKLANDHVLFLEDE
ncbi:hypothetical protein TH24_20460 [Thalassospira xiamenensis]|nr:hypothetical protein TH24_20460 [Thalassospira xiamenensis]